MGAPFVHEGLGESVSGLPGGAVAFTTGRGDGSFGLGSFEPVGEVIARWSALLDRLAGIGVTRLAAAYQVHGARVAVHGSGWHGWLRLREADGHFSDIPGTALAVTIADCTPVLVAHPRGAIASLHAGWRGTAGGILDAGLDAFWNAGYDPGECTVYLGPSICARCYEVGPEVLTALHGRPFTEKGQADVRAVLEEQATRRGVARIEVSGACTRCDNDRFYSHRAGDAGRQLGVIALPGLTIESS